MLQAWIPGLRLGLCRRLRVSYWWLVHGSLATVKLSWSYSIRYLLIDWHAWDTFTFTLTHARVCWGLQLLLNSKRQVILFCSLNRPLRACQRNHSEHRQIDFTFPVVLILRVQWGLRTALMRGPHLNHCALLPSIYIKQLWFSIKSLSSLRTPGHKWWKTLCIL